MARMMDVADKRKDLLRVLIADDNREMRESVANFLGSNFVVVGSVSDGRALVQAALDLKPDIGLVDISMPLMNGIEAVEEIRRLGSEMKVVFLTVHEDPDYLRAALAAGACGYVVKRQMATDLRDALTAAKSDRIFISSGCGLQMNG